MNGFYTCLLGNAVTTIAITHAGTWPGSVALVLIAGVVIIAERRHIERIFARVEHM